MELSSVIESNGTGANDTRLLFDFFSIVSSLPTQIANAQFVALKTQTTTHYRGYPLP